MRQKDFLTAMMVAVAACGPKGAEETPVPSQEWLCRGRTTSSEVSARVDAGTREEALAKFRKDHPDATAPVCTPNPRR
jgi:hypothetical protein